MDKQTLEDLYLNQKLSTRAIAKKFNCSATPINRFLRKYNIPIRHPKRLDITKEELFDLYHNKGMSLLDIAKLKNAAFQSIHDLMVKWDIERREYGTKGLKFPGRKLTEEQKHHLSVVHTGKKLSPEHSKKVSKVLIEYSKKRKLKNGTIVNSHSGYKQIKVGNRWVYLHRSIVEKHIKRTLKREEEVHHINFNPEDNRIENLLVIDRKEHLRLHSRLEAMMRKLMEQGIVVFKDGEYVANL